MTVKPTKLLIKAVEESKMFLFEESEPTNCYICDMFKMKHEMLNETIENKKN